MKKIIFLLLAVALLWPNAGTHAAYNDFVANADVTIYINDLNINLTMKSGANLESYTVNANNLQVIMSTTSTITLESTDKRSFTVTPSLSWQTFTQYCGTDLSSIVLKLPAGTAATTITITPSATACSGGTSGSGSTLGSGSTGGGGGSAAQPSPVPTPPATPVTVRPRVRGTPSPLPSTVAADGTLVKGPGASVYYYHGGRRFVFVNDKAYKTWYPDFKNVKTISAADLSSVPLGGNITYKPGQRMVKITTDPKTYAVDKGGVLRWIKTEAVATALYGATWNKQIDDVADAFFDNYTVGADINSASDFDPAAKKSDTPNIANDFGL